MLAYVPLHREGKLENSLSLLEIAEIETLTALIFTTLL